VEDTTAPILSLPADKTLFQNIPAGAIVKFTATATELVDPLNPVVVCTPASGSTFAPGTIIVKCSATDTAGNIGSGSFTVTVRPARNLLLISEFSDVTGFPHPWNVIGLPAPFNSALDCLIFQSASCSASLFGDKRNTYQAIFQMVKRSGLAGDKYSFGISSRALHIPATAGLYQVELTFYNSWNTVLGTSVLKLTPGTHGFRLARGSASAPANYSHIVFRIVFQKLAGQAWFDDAFLMRIP
jgi:hypothetical protein